MLNDFLRYDMLLLGLGFLFILVLRLLWEKNNTGERGYLAFALLMLANAGLAIRSLSAFPTDPKNAWLLGLSPTRWLLIMVLLLLSLLPIALAWLRPEWKLAWMEWARIRKPALQRMSVLFLLMGLGFQFWSPFVLRAGVDTQLARIGPLVGWGMGALLLLAIMLEGMKGSLTRPLQEYGLIIRGFFREHPPLIYFGMLFVLILLTQINDKGYAHFSDFVEFPEIGIIWDNWIEESWEALGAVEILLAAAVIKLRQDRISM